MEEKRLELGVYNSYFQKSRLFLRPLLGILNKPKPERLGTYIAWDNNISLTDKKIICTYQLSNDQGYKNYERLVLFNNHLFHDFKECRNNIGVYIFNLTDYTHDWECFLKGKYSRFKETTKEKLIKYYPNEHTKEYLKSYLYPDKYFEKYSELLDIPEKKLKAIGELCDPFNVDRETFRGIEIS